MRNHDEDAEVSPWITAPHDHSLVEAANADTITTLAHSSPSSATQTSPKSPWSHPTAGRSGCTETSTCNTLASPSPNHRAAPWPSPASSSASSPVSACREGGGGSASSRTAESPEICGAVLLWHRAADVDSLEPISFRGHRGLAAGATGPPAWSWMAYEGGVEYLDLPFGQVGWEKDDILAAGTWSDKDGAAATVGLSVNARSINTDTLTGALGERIVFFDAPNKTNRPFTCCRLGEDAGAGEARDGQDALRLACD